MINARVNEKGVDLNTEHKIDSWRRDMLADIQMMQSQMQMMRCRDDDIVSSSHSAAIHKETSEM